MDAIQFGQWALVAIAVFAVIKILNKFGLLGQTADEKGREELFNNPAVTGDATTFQAKLKQYLQSKGLPTTTQYIKGIMPSSSQMLAFKDALIKARGFWNDDESKVFNVFRNLNSQLQMYAFSQFFQTYQKKSIIDYLDEFMDESELSMINSIVNSKKIA